MGASSRTGARHLGIFCCGLLVLWMGTGCAVAPPVSTSVIMRQQALLDFTGLLPQQQIDALRVTWAVPRDWELLPPRRGPLYIHQQYRSPSGVTGVGVAFIRMPIPLPAGTLAWLARREYAKRFGDQTEGAVLDHWTDSAGREWFEVKNDRYRGTGYVMVRGREAWIVYSGYRLMHSPNAEEISVSRRSAQTIVPH
jgi:hypothetical protein